MNKLSLSLISTALLGAPAAAQIPNFLMTYSQQEGSMSGSGGTVLANLLPNEMHLVDFTVPCSNVSAEKWLPRTTSHVMAGDENADGTYFNPAIFGSIDALTTTTPFISSVNVENQRTVYFSPSVDMGTNISGSPGLRRGDVGRINRIGFVDGQIEYFITQEQFNNAMGLPAAYPIDIDAIAFQPNYGIFYSVDADVPAMTVCGPTLVRDGDILCLPGGSLSYTADMRIAATTPNSAAIVYSEPQMNVFTNNAQVTDRFGACITTVGDIESLEIDMFGPALNITVCPGIVVPTPNLIYSCENGTGGSLLQTAGAGAIYNTICGPAGTSCGFGPTYGNQVGIRPLSATTGAPSYVNALVSTRACRHVLEPQQHVMNVFPAGAPMGANMIDYYNPFVLSLILIELAPATVPPSFPAAPFSPTCFPDLYAPTITPWLPVGPGYGSFPMIGIPPAWMGKIIYQGVGFGAGVFELSTPTVIDVQ